MEQILEPSCPVEEIVELVPPLPPCIVGSIGRMPRSHHRLRTGLDRHSIGHIEQHSQLHLLDCQHLVLRVSSGS